MAEDDQARSEINMFSAWALGGESALADDKRHSGGGLESVSVNDVSQKKKEKPTDMKQDEISAFAAAAGGDSSFVDKAAFAAAAGSDPSSVEVSKFSQAAQSEMDSGTFAMASTSSRANSKNKDTAGDPASSNLAAAALAFHDDANDDDMNQDGGKGIEGLTSSLTSRMMASTEGPKFRKMSESHPMYVEEVRMPRPLFFGPIVSPRVLNEARKIVQGAIREQEKIQQEQANLKDVSTILSNRPCLGSLRPEVQNIVGALRTYGYGLSAFPPDDGEAATRQGDQASWKGSSYVSTFQPVFGETARLFRHQQDKSEHSTNEDSPSLQNQDEAPKRQAPALISKDYKRSSKPVAAAPVQRMTETEKANASFLANINATDTMDFTPQKTATTFTSTNDNDTSTTPSSCDAVTPTATTNNDVNMFSMWARGEGVTDDLNDNDDAGSQGNYSTSSFGSITEPAKDEKWKKTDTSKAATPSSSGLTTQAQPMSDQDLFGKWARGESPSENVESNNLSSDTFQTEEIRNSKDTFVTQEKVAAKIVTLRSDPMGTFQLIPTSKVDNDSDDDSIVGSELKKKVGVNEHLDAALASLIDDGPTGVMEDDEKDNALLQIARATPGGRPLSNLELTNGCVPVFGVDDAPLPVEGDLGIHETKNDEQRTLELKKSQDLIDKYVGPNLFGPVACPNPASGPNDNHSWNSRSAPSQRYTMGPGTHTSGTDRVAVLPLPSDTNNQSPRPPSGRKAPRHLSPRGASRRQFATPLSRKGSSKSTASAANKRNGRFNIRHRYGWWSVPEDHEPSKKVASSDASVVSVASSAQSTAESILEDHEIGEESLQLPPMHHMAFSLHVDTRLEPGPQKLRKENLPLSELHSATTMAQSLPYLSDRPPSYRYLQIDTQAVGFPPLGGEVEPLFCSLVIYNVETVNGGANDTSSPVPDLQRCGRVTEALNFDIVTDQQVEDRCLGSLWPFYASSTMTPKTRPEKNFASKGTASMNPSLQQTRCGVFPLPSNLDVSNLYAVLIVHKVLSEDSDFEIYLKQSKASKAAGVDIHKFRARAEKASNQHGSFLMPFAFGVAPLLQVFGSDNPLVASSRAVQIPLFRFSAGLGDRQIIDHIMVMLYPRADFRANGVGGPAAVTNGGTAMLVMRNFGYLGLHAVVHSRSSLARDRLVDFTGELQIRRRNENDAASKDDLVFNTKDHLYVVPEWHTQFVSEPAIDGGRNHVDPLNSGVKLEKLDDNPSRSPLYAQELAPVPLSPPPSNSATKQAAASCMPSRTRPSFQRGDIEPFYHTSFCNEMLCHPRLLQNCPKGNIVLKVEMRELEFRQEYNAFFAHLPQHGPSIHNTRRGPFLIQGTYTSCAVRSSDPLFLDEVKIKLPLELKPNRKDGISRTLALFFSVYHVKFSSKKKWSKVIPKSMVGLKRDSRLSHVNDVDDATGEPQEHQEEGGLADKCKLVQLSCGFLPVTSQSCLVENGLHDVKMIYKGRNPSPEMRSKGVPASTLIVREKTEASVHSQASSIGGFDPREDESTTGTLRTHSEADLIPCDESDSAYSDFSQDDRSKCNTTSTAYSLSQAEASHKSKSSREQMTLQVRVVVHSSLHTQSPTLCNFLQNESDIVNTFEKSKQASFLLKLGRDEIVQELEFKSTGSSRIVSQDEESLLGTVAGLARPQSCSTNELTKHLLRISTKLLKTLVMGAGQSADFAWANPGSMLPLRVHAFGTLLQVLYSASLYMLKSGVTQVDGSSKFDLLTLGSILALVFDEESIFGADMMEILGDFDLFAKPPELAKVGTLSGKAGAGLLGDAQAEEWKEILERRPRHQRNTMEFSRGSADMSDPTSKTNIASFGLKTSSLPQLSKPKAVEMRQSSAPASMSVPSRSLPPPTARPAGKKSSLGIETYVRDLDSTHLSPPSRPKASVKVDSVADFRNNMELGLQSEDGDTVDAPLTESNVTSIMQKFGGLSGAGKNRWRTAPSPNLMTIKEDEPEVLNEPAPLPLMQSRLGAEESTGDSLDEEMVLGQKKGPSKQFRRPKLKSSSAQSNEAEVDLDLSMIAEKAVAFTTDRKYATLTGPPEPSKVDPFFAARAPETDEELAAVEASLLGSIGVSLDGPSKNINVDEGRGHRKTQSMHRKTRSRCSFDWATIKGDGLEPTSNNKAKSSLPLEPEADDHNDSMKTLELENDNCITLPNYADRLVALGKSGSNVGRWFPYTYEVVIMTWTAFLVQQRSTANRTGASTGPSNGFTTFGTNSESDVILAGVAASAQRSTIACAPLLFEIIKQSLAYRVKLIVEKGYSGAEKCRCPPLAILDEGLQAALETLISIITDSCLDSRNFDSRDVRQMSIDVNDSIVHFLRDMFGFLKPTSAYRLVMVYLSRFVTKEGKQWQDRDSSIGLRCSWEITKLRLNAVTALIRFPDFLRVCSPQMNSWGDSWLSLQGDAQDNFFNSVLDHYKRLELPDFVTDGAFLTAQVEIPPMRPHWLAELVTEICLQGTEHAEQYIQMRASSLLHELFWTSSQQSMGRGTSQVVTSMYVTFLDKVLFRSSYLSNFAPKSQLRKDILPCVLLVLQGAPSGLLRAQWRKLLTRTEGKGRSDRFGELMVEESADFRSTQDQMRNDPDILDMFTLLNMALSTVEYEGCEDLLESDNGEHDDLLHMWQKEYLLSQGNENQQPFMAQRPSLRGGSRLDVKSISKTQKAEKEFYTSGSRKWQSHDASMVAIQCGSHIVNELSSLLRPKKPKLPLIMSFEETPKEELKFSRSDTIIFMRAAASLYLHCLALRQSDIVLVRTFKVSADLVKIFGIKMFLEAVGETLQHWLRVIMLHCGGRRAKVRIEATDFLELVLRCTWESFGSFFRIRVPLLAIQTEVMERIVSIAAARYYREERRKATTLDNFSNASAEASLAPLWRTLDRLHHQPASHNVAFKGALVRLAVKLKKLYRAYIAARALSYLNGIRSPKQPEDRQCSSDTNALVQAYRITVLRVINASAAYSKQFLGFQGTSLSNSSVAHYEAVEDAFLEAADVFSPTELPEHRVAWLQMLADFHGARNKRAEEATCHFQIHVTLKQAFFLHGSLWSNTPFLPWTNNHNDPGYVDGEVPTGNPLDHTSDFDFSDLPESPYGRHMDGADSSRRIFYRVANSVRANTEDWETGLSKTLFSGSTFAAEYNSVSSWLTLREMEEKMVEEAEIAGDLFLQSGIIESSRFAWNLASEYYSSKFMYAKLNNVYGCLARAVVSQVPPIDASHQQEVSISMGRFYRVYFHGGAPDELIGAEFVYRTASGLRLDQFGEQLREVIRCIVPDRTPIHLQLDGRTDEASQRSYGGFSRLGPAPLEPVTIKVTTLRPLFAKGAKIRGLPEWFHRYIDEIVARTPSRQSTNRRRSGPRTGLGEMSKMKTPGHRGNNLSFGSSASVFASGGSSSGSVLSSRRSSMSKVTDGGRGGPCPASSSAETELVGVDKFAFLQAVHHKERIRGNKDWWKPASGDIARKSLKVTQLQVGQFFPACVTRQPVIHRVVFTLSPLEAGVDASCQWSSVLFRTAVATNGMAVLGTNPEPGIGTHAAKVVADCIHSSRVKEMGLSLLKKTGNVKEEDDIFQRADRLMEDEVNKFQQKLARSIVVFLELLHLLIARNRDLLLNVIQDRRKETPPPMPSAQGFARTQSAATSAFPPTHGLARSQISSISNSRGLMRPRSFDESEGQTKKRSQSVNMEAIRNTTRYPSREASAVSSGDDQSYSGGSLAGGAGNIRTDSAIAVQSELQRAFISLTKTLYPGISGILKSEMPRWLKLCCQENYFSLGTYKQTKIPIGEELYFSSVSESNFHSAASKTSQNTEFSAAGPGGLGIILRADHLGESDHRNRESPAPSVGSRSSAPLSRRSTPTEA